MGNDNNRGLLIAIGAFVVGLLLGWLLLGWGLFPVTYTNAYLQDVRPEQQQGYLEATAEGYELTQDSAVALGRLQLLGSPAAVTELAAATIQDAESRGDLTTANRVRSMAIAVGLDVAGPAEAVGEESSSASAEEGGLSLGTICGGGLGLAILLGGIALAVSYTHLTLPTN